MNPRKTVFDILFAASVGLSTADVGLYHTAFDILFLSWFSKSWSCCFWGGSAGAWICSEPRQNILFVIIFAKVLLHAQGLRLISCDTVIP